jgi:hypothetical protein
MILRMLLLPAPTLELLVLQSYVKTFKSLVNGDVMRPKHFHVCVAFSLLFHAFSLSFQRTPAKNVSYPSKEGW